MNIPSLLPSILSNRQNPHQSFCLVLDTATTSGIPLLKESIKLSLEAELPVLLLTVLHPPSAYGLTSDLVQCEPKVKILDLTSSIIGFEDSADSTTETRSITEIKKWILREVEALGRGAQVYIDALDVLAEDYGTMQGAVGLVKSILKALSDLKAPSRLTLLLPSNSTLLAHLLPPSLSPTITTLTLHPPSLISHLSHQHLIIPSIPGEGPPGSGERFWEVLRKAGEGEVAVEMALSGEGGLEVGHWSKVHVSSGSGSGVYLVGFGGGPSSVKGKGKMIGGAGVGGYSEGSGVIVEILVRKAQGGAGKGMSRSLEGLRHVSVFVGSKGKEKMSQEMEVAEGRLECCRWEEVRGMEMVGRKFGSGREEVETQGSSEAEQSSNSSHPSQAHIPFNLSLTSSQQASRAEVPIPYAHEGEEATSTSAGGGAAGATIYFEPGSDDDMDEDDPDEDLDF